MMLSAKQKRVLRYLEKFDSGVEVDQLFAGMEEKKTTEFLAEIKLLEKNGYVAIAYFAGGAYSA